MNSSSRFACANHVLALLALSPHEALTSEMMAGSVNTNPVVIRRILGLLRAAGIVTSQPGSRGGWRLAREPRAITLRDVYRAVETEPLFALHHRVPNHHCDVGRNIQEVLVGVFEDAQSAMEQRLAGSTIADILERMPGKACEPA